MFSCCFRWSRICRMSSPVRGCYSASTLSSRTRYLWLCVSEHLKCVWFTPLHLFTHSMISDLTYLRTHASSERYALAEPVCVCVCARRISVTVRSCGLLSAPCRSDWLQQVNPVSRCVRRSSWSVNPPSSSISIKTRICSGTSAAVLHPDSRGQCAAAFHRPFRSPWN